MNKVEPKIPMMPPPRTMDDAVANVHEQIEALARKGSVMGPAAIVDKSAQEPPTGLTEVERYAETLAKSLLAGAEQLVLEAQSLLNDDQKFAEELRAHIMERVKRHAAFIERLRSYRETNTQARELLRAEAEKGGE